MAGADAANIVMAKEEVTVTLHDGFAVVDAVFEMSNQDAEKTLQVGFPGEGVIVRDGRGHAAHRALLGFGAWVNGAKVEVAPKVEEIVTTSGPPGREYSKRREETWHTFKVHFAAKKATAVRVRYAVLADGYRGESFSSDELFADGTVSYVLATGARWGGRIGEAVIRVRAGKGVSLSSVRVRDNKMKPLEKREAGAKVTAVLPAYGTRSAKEVTLLRRDFEPVTDDNLEVVYAWKTPRRAGDPAVEAELTRAAEAAVGAK